MKKVFSIILALVMITALFAGCADNGNDQSAAGQSSSVAGSSSGGDTSENGDISEPIEGDDSSAGTPEGENTDFTEEPTTIRLGGLKGPTSIGMVKLLSDAENGESVNDYSFQLAGSADELTPLLLKGELDILAVPVNLASVLYNNSDGAVQLLAVNTLGVIYIVEKGGETVTDIESLRGKTIYATGKGSTPEYAINYLLEQNGLDPAIDVTIEWKSEPAEIVALMATEENTVAMMPQPFVTVAQSKFEDLRVAIDLTAEWDALDNGSQLITAGLVVRTEFANKYPEQLAKFLEEYSASTEYVNSNVADAAQLVEHFDIVTAAVAEKAIPFCNIVCIMGQEMKDGVSGYLEVLYNANDKAVGGAIPGDDFYRIIE